jgi:hypothetical protein
MGMIPPKSAGVIYRAFIKLLNPHIGHAERRAESRGLEGLRSFTSLRMTEYNVFNSRIAYIPPHLSPGTITST